ncbi:hypothetical protein [Hymenobacter sp.]|uniref:hypothetical protein n=1 Tax=Hymenobacter sp. TaxID=1898978 RepID=UPI00286C69AD|nr:hypothetical protein [Hymenobacter sp.]
MSEASDLRTVRAWLGLTQAELAKWLGVSRERVAKAEIEQRPLPFAAWPRLTQLTLGRAAGPAVPPEALAAATAYQAPLRARLRECRYQAARLRQALAVLRARAEPLTQRLAALPGLATALPAGAAGEDRRRWLARLVAEATDGLAAECGPLPQALLAARIAAYEHEAALLEAWPAPAGDQ